MPDRIQTCINLGCNQMPNHSSHRHICLKEFFLKWRRREQSKPLWWFWRPLVYLKHCDIKWWTITELNRSPPACKAGALPDELMALKWYLQLELNQRPLSYQLSALTN